MKHPNSRTLSAADTTAALIADTTRAQSHAADPARSGWVSENAGFDHANAPPLACGNRA